MVKKNIFKFKPCSCGKDLLNEDYFDDTLYPMNRERTKFNAYCNPLYSGCGRTVYGQSIKEVSIRWNNNLTDEIISL